MAPRASTFLRRRRLKRWERATNNNLILRRERSERLGRWGYTIIGAHPSSSSAPKGKVARTPRTGSDDRVADMRAFAAEALKLLDE